MGMNGDILKGLFNHNRKKNYLLPASGFKFGHHE